MNYLNIELQVQDLPELDIGFIPMSAFHAAFLKTATKPIKIAIERNNGLTSVLDTRMHGTADKLEADRFFIERTVKFLLWAKGGVTVYICGDEDMAQYIKQVYSADGMRSFDYHFMSRVYEREFSVRSLCYADAPAEMESPKAIGRNLSGCRIGFDAGGSDRKVSAVIDGNAVFSEEVVWFPKTNSDPLYHYDGICQALKKAASKLPRVDSIGVSSAGIYIDNKTMVASLFLKVSDADFEKTVKHIYTDAAKQIGAPVNVVNDGDVTALAGAMALEDNAVLGIAMGTSEAVGYVDPDGKITGWLNELAFAPVDAQVDGAVDEWSGDKGCGVKYFSQDSVIKLAPRAGIALDAALSPAECLKVVQKELEDGNPGAEKIYRSIGCYLAHALAYYANFYPMRHVLLLGRVVSGKGGDIVLNTAKQIMHRAYPDLAAALNVQLPDEKTRRVGQSVAAASL